MRESLRLQRDALQAQDKAWKLIESSATEASLPAFFSMMRTCMPVPDFNIKQEPLDPFYQTSTSESETEGDSAGATSTDLKPITIRLAANKYEYLCPACPEKFILKTRNAMKGHIRKMHQNKALECPAESCLYTCYNDDQMNKHISDKH